MVMAAQEGTRIESADDLVSKLNDARDAGSYAEAESLRLELKANGCNNIEKSENVVYKGDSLRRRKSRRKNARGVIKKARFRIFAQWLVDTFGEETLRAGVIDVAGGKGKMAVELCIDRGIPTTVVDPNFAPMSAFTTRRIIKIASDFYKENNDNPRNSATTDYIQHKDLLDVFEFFDANERKRIPIEYLELGKKYVRGLGFEFHACLFDETYVNNDTGIKKWNEASIVIGMHPDEATEAIVDEALRHNKSFAVVPCCVFPSKFPSRCLPDGTHVRSLEQFITYLSLKHPSIKQHVFDELPACKTVLYRKI